MPREDSPSASNTPRSAGILTRIATSRASRSRRLSSGRISEASRRTDSSSRSSLPRTRTSVPVSMRPALRWKASGKHDDFHAALCVLEREDRHAIALARLQRPARGDDAADARVGLDGLGPAGAPCVGARGRRRFRQIAGRPGAKLLQVVAVAIGRMAAPVQARAFPFRTRAARSRSTAPPRAAGHRLPERRSRLPPPNSWACPSFLSRCSRAPYSHATSTAATSRGLTSRRMSGDAAGQRVERAGFGQALEHALVEQAEIEILAERLQRRDRALRAADGQQRLDRALADVLDGRQAETDARRGHREAQLALVDVGRQDGNAAVAAFTEIQRELVGVLRLRSSAARPRSATGSSPSGTRSGTRETRTPSSATC